MDFGFSPELIWFVIGFIFMLIEFTLPGLVILFFGLGAWVTALSCLIFSPSLNIQLLIFIISSAFSLLVLRKKFNHIFIGKSSRTATPEQLDSEFIGKQVSVVQTITPPHSGKVELNGVNWNAKADEEIKEGEVVRIIEKVGLSFKVEKIAK